MTDNRYVLATNVGADNHPTGCDVIINIKAARNIVREPNGTVVLWFDGQHKLSFSAGGADKLWALAKEYCGVGSPVPMPVIGPGQPRS